MQNEKRLLEVSSVELRDEGEEFIIVERARKRGYNMSIIITMTVLIFLSSLQAVTTANILIKKRIDHKPNIIDTSHHIDRHVQLFSMSSNIKSEHLHDISIPRHQAKGMWLPSHPITHLIRKHANSVTKTKIPDRKDVDKTTNSSLKAWIQSPATFSGSLSDNLAILTKHGYDIEPLLEDVKFMTLKSSSETNDVTYDMNEKRLAPLLVKALLVGANVILGGLIDLGCTVGAQSLGFTETAKYLCIGAAFLFASLGSWGSLYTRARLVQAAANPVSQNAAEIAMGSISVAQGTLGGRGSNNRLWFEDNLVFFQEAYEKSLMIDDEMLNERDKHYDKNIGQSLSAWDIIISHIYPIQLVIHPGFNPSFWYESDIFGNHFTFGWNLQIKSNSTLQLRQCESTDAEIDYNEDPSETYCEQGQSVVPEGVYMSYELLNTSEEQDDSAHLRLGNDSYAFEKAKLDGMLAYLGGTSAVCEGIQYNDQRMAYSVMQVAYASDPVAGFDACENNQ
ncbi:uncharacterized protein FA14DRAFT_186447 [Meira miltonrushii]|uniref:Uncharacterized protein n=1 Tax=Meira miltonrushii TaxID=1280837 RepID=A0A316V7B5_9BASI|nr:uncharacterized protein FA14DRAFT_186447 [Meira miltonrushii]PWN31365.1 hypothetical protein FA14DRAFT_186447 [Meira miltonrushii]